MVAAELEDYVDVLGILEDMVEKQDVFVVERFVDFNLGDQLDKRGGTFCLALDFLRVYLDTILTAYCFLV